jgi:hypothetical protein
MLLAVETGSLNYQGISQSSGCIGEILLRLVDKLYRGADMSLARPGRKQAAATEDFEFHISYL